MFRNLLLFTALFSGGLTTAVSAQDCQDMKGVWQTQSGALLTINRINSSTGHMEGTFKSPSTLFNDGPHTISGFITKALTDPASPASPQTSTIAFSVKWPSESSSSWTGYCQIKSGVPTITSLWHWVMPNPDKPIEHFRSGYTVFTPRVTK